MRIFWLGIFRGEFTRGEFDAWDLSGYRGSKKIPSPGKLPPGKFSPIKLPPSEFSPEKPGGNFLGENFPG